MQNSSAVRICRLSVTGGHLLIRESKMKHNDKQEKLAKAFKALLKEGAFGSQAEIVTALQEMG
jgi:hypothetical protein